MGFNKPNIPKLTLTPLVRTKCLSILPMDICGCTTDYELVCHLLKIVNDLITKLDTTNSTVNQLIDSYNKLIDYVNNYFDSLDIGQAIEDEINRILENGELIKYLEPVIPTVNLSLRRMGRQVFSNEVPQGGCYINNYNVVQFRENEAKTGSFMQILNLLTGNVQVNISFPDIVHPNSVAYIPTENAIYVSTSAIGNQGKAYKILLSDYSASEVDVAAPASFTQIYNIAYDRVTNNFLVNYGTAICVYNWTTKDVIYDGTFTWPYNIINFALQAIQMHNGELFIYNLDTILVYDENTAKYKRGYAIPRWADERYYIGEIEAIYFDENNNMLASSVCRYRGDSPYLLCQYFQGSINKGIISDYDGDPYTYVSGDYIGVDYASTAWNPTGLTDYGGRFKYIDEAFLYLDSPYVNKKHVTIVSADPQGLYITSLNKPVIVHCSDIDIPVKIFNSQFVEIDNANITDFKIGDSYVKLRANCSMSQTGGYINQSEILDMNNVLNMYTGTFNHSNIHTAANIAVDQTNLLVSPSGSLISVSNGVAEGFTNLNYYFLVRLNYGAQNKNYYYVTELFLLNNGTVQLVLLDGDRIILATITSQKTGTTLNFTVAAKYMDDSSSANVVVRSITPIRMA